MTAVTMSLWMFLYNKR